MEGSEPLNSTMVADNEAMQRAWGAVVLEEASKEALRPVEPVTNAATVNGVDSSFNGYAPALSASVEQDACDAKEKFLLIPNGHYSRVLSVDFKAPNIDSLLEQVHMKAAEEMNMDPTGIQLYDARGCSPVPFDGGIPTARSPEAGGSVAAVGEKGCSPVPFDGGIPTARSPEAGGSVAAVGEKGLKGITDPWPSIRELFKRLLSFEESMKATVSRLTTQLLEERKVVVSFEEAMRATVSQLTAQVLDERRVREIAVSELTQKVDTAVCSIVQNLGDQDGSKSLVDPQHPGASGADTWQAEKTASQWKEILDDRGEDSTLWETKVAGALIALGGEICRRLHTVEYETYGHTKVVTDFEVSRIADAKRIDDLYTQMQVACESTQLQSEALSTAIDGIIHWIGEGVPPESTGCAAAADRLLAVGENSDKVDEAPALMSMDSLQAIREKNDIALRNALGAARVRLRNVPIANYRWRPKPSSSTSASTCSSIRVAAKLVNVPPTTAPAPTGITDISKVKRLPVSLVPVQTTPPQVERRISAASPALQGAFAATKVAVQRRSLSPCSPPPRCSSFNLSGMRLQVRESSLPPGPSRGPSRESSVRRRIASHSPLRSSFGAKSSARDSSAPPIDRNPSPSAAWTHSQGRQPSRQSATSGGSHVSRQAELRSRSLTPENFGPRLNLRNKLHLLTTGTNQGEVSAALQSVRSSATLGSGVTLEHHGRSSARGHSSANAPSSPESPGTRVPSVKGSDTHVVGAAMSTSPGFAPRIRVSPNIKASVGSFPRSLSPRRSITPDRRTANVSPDAQRNPTLRPFRRLVSGSFGIGTGA